MAMQSPLNHSRARLREALEATPDWLFSQAYIDELLNNFENEVRLELFAELQRALYGGEDE
jgi:hypothetical protein